MFTMRFDMRAPAFGASPANLYEAALEMVSWGEANGCLAVQVSEHHGASDGYLPAPLILASAMVARTTTLPIQVAALILPLHDPIEMAEQMAVLDLVSKGRVSYVVAIGYVKSEFAMLGRKFPGRHRRIEESVEVMRRAWSGETFEFEGRPIRVTPLPHTPGGPTMLMGGGVAAAARRAARLGMGMVAMGGDPALESVYLEACRAEGRAPGFFVNPRPGVAMSAFVARDPDEAWARWGPHLLHDARMYAEDMGDRIDSATKSDALTVESLRASPGNYRIYSVEEAIAVVKEQGVFMTQPLCGGLPIEYAWESLETLVSDVLPKVQSSSAGEAGKASAQAVSSET